MLQADEVDIDYFTPMASTSLANIFGNDTKLEEKDKASLKYVPTAPQSLSSKQEESKGTQIIYACTFFGYEWSNNAYLSRGKLGAAILKTLKSGHHNIVLYDSNKITLSCTLISTQLEVTIKESTNLSYYDNHKKYWSIYGTETETSRFIEKLKLLNVQIHNSLNTETGPSEANMEKCEVNVTSRQILEENKESDTDSLINRRTKDSILKRMATMGHSVLPIQATTFTKSSYSSDSDEWSPKVLKHKPQKNNFKRNFTEKDLHTDSCTEINLKKVAPKLKHSDNVPLSTYDQQLVPIKSTKIITSPIINSSNDLNMFMSEQRINNSELRININRISDKVDKILESIQGDSENNISTINFHNKLVQKLLAEYENKIKTYEDFIISKGLDCNSIIKSSQKYEEVAEKDLIDVDFNKNRIQELETIIQEKERENSQLKHEFMSLQVKYDIVCKESEKKKDDNLKEVNILNQELLSKKEELTTLSKNLQSISLQNNDDFKSKLKFVMNRTFHSLSANFDSNECYTGTTIKSVVANVIKKRNNCSIK